MMAEVLQSTEIGILQKIFDGSMLILYYINCIIIQMIFDGSMLILYYIVQYQRVACDKNRQVPALQKPDKFAIVKCIFC